ncbi:MAG: alpha/beta fold hydrolase [Streptomycetaceae bacterium]|nr:alpha/beta fold hydrolase [Streptomycetaceae bacterium]
MNTLLRRSALVRRALPAALVATALISGCSTGAAGKVKDAESSAPSSAANGSDAGPLKPVSGGKGQDDPALQSFYTQKLDWAACPDDPETDGDETELDCAEMRVPLDYANPGARSIDIAVMRYKAADGGSRIGSLLTNPGGPGASGLEYLENTVQDLSPDVHRSFDVVGFDPRGVGKSTAVQCLTDAERDKRNSEDGPDPKDQAAYKAFNDKRAKDFAAGCQAKSGDLLKFVGTRNVARDMDVLRYLVGDKKLNYLGFSYGTYLGALYAEEFPGRTGRLVLDGAVDPAADQLDESVGQQVGFEQSFTRFAKDCATRAGCPLGSDPAKAAANGVDFLDSLRTKPLPTEDPRRKLTSSLAWTGMIRLLYADESQGWKALRETFAAAMQRGNGSLFLRFADDYNGRDERGRYDNSMDALTVVGCADSMADAPSPARVQETLAKLRAQAPLFSRDASADDLDGPGCEFWPFRTPEKPHTVKAAGSAPILVVGTTGDPATPYAASQKLAQGFEKATLLTFEGEGHTAYSRGNQCIDDAVNAYLLEGTMPAQGTRCK